MEGGASTAGGSANTDATSAAASEPCRAIADRAAVAVRPEHFEQPRDLFVIGREVHGAVVRDQPDLVLRKQAPADEPQQRVRASRDAPEYLRARPARGR